MNGKSLFVRISPELDTRFRQFIAEKYGTYEKGLLSHEVSEAMKQWMALHTTAQKSLLPPMGPNPTPKVSIAYQRVKQVIQSAYEMPLRPGQEVPKKIIEDAILTAKGHDPRTILNWFKTFHRMGLIKPTQGSLWEVL